MLLEILEAESPMTFARYMELCLYHERYGYYARGPRLGREGDYFTSPTVHRVFGATLARQILEIYELLGAPEEFLLVEAGAGEGWLARDLLDYLERKGRPFPYLIVEPLPNLKSLQEETLRPHASRVRWVKDLSEIPPFTGVFLSNELFDSLPVHLLEKTPEDLKEVYVEVSGGEIREVLSEISQPEILKRVLPYALYWPEGYRTEVCLAYEPLYKELSKKLVRGAILTLDYGFPRPDYYHPQRSRGTLLAYFRHRASENPYARPGHQDLTAHVDFTALRELGEKYGFLNLGFIQQGPFLVGLRVEEVLAEVSENTFRDREALKLLVLPEGLGHSHWVLIQGRGLAEEAPLSGLRLANRINLLY
ncbi:SAM-dependent methyltransferase [Thermosulfurimonas marina]|uniref:SAM-dependent methyltransferase n=1 Tax=Thermosulfurimonas marina TaxID=2047767 RepID=A0A6H1WQX6_9BACT|nr:SAM-dependent methyltransferase [Thermosulfurimonas marina]QJA05560.1 SAM-dependent methyltransferase [Thermosulfurimonas marina]